MTWVAWRLQRTETLIAAGILVLLAALLIPTGLSMAHAYSHDGLASCLALNPSEGCNQTINNFESHYQSLTTLTNFFTLIPGIIGVALAAPFIFELEHGTYRLAWTQSITRNRWLAGKLALPIIGALLSAGVMIALMTWWRTPYVHLNGRLDNGVYDSEGTVVFGYTLFALGLALALGAVWRRASVAITVSFVGYFIARISVDTWLRDQLVSPLKITWKGFAQPLRLYHARVLTQNGVGAIPNGVHISGHSIGIRPGANGGSVVFHATYQPASHFWPLQLAETSLFAGVAVALILFAAWWTRQRAA